MVEESAVEGDKATLQCAGGRDKARHPEAGLSQLNHGEEVVQSAGNEGEGGVAGAHECVSFLLC